MMESLKTTLEIFAAITFIIMTAKLFVDLGRILKGQEQTDKRLEKVEAKVDGLDGKFNAMALQQVRTEAEQKAIGDRVPTLRNLISAGE
jgi:cytochrome c peroxidase